MLIMILDYSSSSTDLGDIQKKLSYMLLVLLAIPCFFKLETHMPLD